VKLALPKGRLLKDTAALLAETGLGLTDYNEQSRSYHLTSPRFRNLLAKVFQEKDIPVQVAIGNYDLGICGHDWVQELLSRYPNESLVTVGELAYGRGDLYLVASKHSGISSIDDIGNGFDKVRIVSEYPNLAELFALKHRLRRFSVLPVWGAAEVYPPESAEMAIISENSVSSFEEYSLVTLARVLRSTAVLIANRHSLASSDMSELLAGIPLSACEPDTDKPLCPPKLDRMESSPQHDAVVWLALPDGHQQQPTVDFLKRAGIQVKGYSKQFITRRPAIDLAGVSVKVIRPQDMPLHVANNNFDLALTGEDWLTDHSCRFPSSPVQKITTLGFGIVTIVAVVSESLPIDNVNQLRAEAGKLLPTVRVASEYVNIADKYARENHLGRYRIIPTWGASEAFLPEDADLLIENTQTGGTLKKHKLRVIDTLFKSSACLIANSNSLSNPMKRDRMRDIINTMEQTAMKG